MKKRKKLGKGFYRSLALISQSGIHMLVPIGLMLWLGVWLDRRLGTYWLTILFFFLGALAGFQNIYRMAKKLMDSEKDMNSERDINSGKREELKMQENQKEIR